MGTSRSDFLANRRRGIGGSDVAVILGLIGSKADLWLEKTGQGRAKEQTDRMSAGIALEPFILAEYRRRRPGHKVRRCSRQLRHKRFPQLVGHVDALVGNEGIAEFKFSTSTQGWGPDGTDRMPAYYRTQCLHYLDVTGRTWVELLAFFGDTGEWRLYRIDRTGAVEAEIQENRAKALEFWRTYVEGNVPPPPETSMDCAKLWPEATAEAEAEFDDETLQALLRLSEKKAAMKDLEAEANKLDVIVKSKLQDREAGRYQGRTVVTWSTQSRAGFDTKRLQAEEPEVAARYATQTSYRVLRIKDRELLGLMAATVPDDYQAGRE